MAELQFQNYYTLFSASMLRAPTALSGSRYSNLITPFHLLPREPRTLILKSRDNELMEVEKDVAYESLTIQAMSKHLGPKSEPPVRAFMVPLTTKLLRCVIDYCKYQVESREYANRNPSESQRGKWKTWEERYEKLAFGSICDLLLAATYMDVPSMANMLSRLAASKMPRGSKDLPPDREENDKLLLQVCKKGAMRGHPTFPYLPRCIQDITKLMLHLGAFRKTSSVRC